MRLKESSSALLTRAAVFLALGSLLVTWIILSKESGPSTTSAAPLGGCLVTAIMSYSCFRDARWIRRASAIPLQLADTVVELDVSIPAGNSIVGFYPYSAVYLSCRNIVALSPTGEQLATVVVWREPWTNKLPRWLQGLEYGPRQPLARLDPVTMKIGKSKQDRRVILRFTPRPPSSEKLEDAEIGVIIK